jgi:hypothetical protein
MWPPADVTKRAALRQVAGPQDTPRWTRLFPLDMGSIVAFCRPGRPSSGPTPARPPPSGTH